MKFNKIPVPENLERWLKKEGSIWVKAYVSDEGLRILYSKDQVQHGKLLHLSISHKDRYPSWDEIVETKTVIMGDIDVMMILPKAIDYVNISENCFHLWETPKEWGVR